LTLNIEQARADTFKAIKSYNQTRKLIPDMDPSEDDDQELYDFIDIYIGEKDITKIDVPSMIKDLHKLKSRALGKILKSVDLIPFIKMRDNYCALDLRHLKKQKDSNKSYEEVCQTYQKEFLLKIEPIIKPLSSATWMAHRTIQAFLEKKLNENNLKNTIRNFADYELKKCRAEIKILDKFTDGVDNIDPASLNSIKICSTQPFNFLNHPFPLI
jgi:hypothetical protein